MLTGIHRPPSYSGRFSLPMATTRGARCGLIHRLVHRRAEAAGAESCETEVVQTLIFLTSVKI